jgi:hypothetical protein
MSAIAQAITPNSHTNLLNVYIQIANRMGFQPPKKQKGKKNYLTSLAVKAAGAYTSSLTCIYQRGEE